MLCVCGFSIRGIIFVYINISLVVLYVGGILVFICTEGGVYFRVKSFFLGKGGVGEEIEMVLCTFIRGFVFCIFLFLEEKIGGDEK